MNDPSRPTILIVDDSPTMRAMISTALTEGGYRVVEAADGKDGLARLQLHAVQLILTDVNMPRMDGLAFLQSLRQDPRFARTPVLMLTTESSQEMKGRGKAAGATGWIVKPFRPEDLRQVVGKVLAGPSSRQPAARIRRLTDDRRGSPETTATMSDDLDLVQAFNEEAAELLESFEQGLLELEKTPGDPEVLNRIFRAAHTIKGNSAMLGFGDIAQFTHTLEDVLDRMRKGRLRLTREGMTLLLRSLDMLKLKLAALTRAGEGAPDATALVHALHAYVDESRTQPCGPGTRRAESRTQPCGPGTRRAERQGGESGNRGIGESETREHITASCNLQSAICNLQSEMGSEEEPLRLGEILVAEKLVTPQQVTEALAKQKRIGEILVEDEVLSPEHVAFALEKQMSAAPRADASSIRVQTEKVDRLINLVGEMVITQSMLTQIASKFSLDELPQLTDAVAVMERHSRELQERVMAVRMVPIKAAFRRFPRMVRDLAGQFGKRVNLELRGEETELDKTVIERISDPLAHLIRNSVDHGIELPALRQAQGKPEQGLVRLSAYHQGGAVYIEVQDDGKGLDRGRILRKAVEMGLVSEGEALTEEQACELVFRPGFSTAEKITDVSGRGVGMDVVRRNVQLLGGSIAIRSEPGRGCTFTIKLPLTLAILDGLSVQVGEQVFIIPLVNITESLRPKPVQVQRVVCGGEVVDMRGHVLPILRLHQILGVTTQVTDPSQGILVIVENGGVKVALLVDDLLGQHQVVIKSLEANYGRVEGVSGATIMGDGRVALILDVPGLVRLAAGRQALRLAA